MQVIHITALGARSYLNMTTGVVGGVAERQARRRGPTGGARGPVFRVREFWVRDAETGEKIAAKALPASFPVRNGQQATLVFAHFGKKSERLLAARNNSSGDCLQLPPARSLTLSLLLWLVLGWLAFWVTDLALTFDHRPGLVLIALVLWILAGLWYFLHGRAFRSRLGDALTGGPERMALLVER